MLRSKDESLRTLPGGYLQQVLSYMQRPGQSRSDIIRRSAGVPYAAVALFLAEIGEPRRVCTVAVACAPPIHPKSQARLRGRHSALLIGGLRRRL